VAADPVVSLWFGAGPRWWLCGAKRRQSWWLSCGGGDTRRRVSSRSEGQVGNESVWVACG